MDLALLGSDNWRHIQTVAVMFPKERLGSQRLL